MPEKPLKKSLGLLGVYAIATGATLSAGADRTRAVRLACSRCGEFVRFSWDPSRRWTAYRIKLQGSGYYPSNGEPNAGQCIGKPSRPA